MENKKIKKIKREPLSEEHKRKIAESNRIALKKFYEKNPGIKNSGMFKKGHISQFKGKEFPQWQGENHYRWKGGSRATSRTIAKRYGKDMNTCQICKEFSLTKRRVVHHIDGNPWNNEERNQSILCDICHNAIHDNPNKRNTRFQKGHTGYNGKVQLNKMVKNNGI